MTKFNTPETINKTDIVKVCFAYDLTKLFLSYKIKAKIGTINPPIIVKKLKFTRKAAALALKPAIDFCSLILLLSINSSQHIFNAIKLLIFIFFSISYIIIYFKFFISNH